MRIVVLGAGAVGGVVAARLHRSGQPVVAVARGAHYRAVARHGLTLASPQGAESIAVPVVATVAEARLRPDDVVALAVKSQDTEAALAALEAAGVRVRAIACLQNGVANERAAQRLGVDVYGVEVLLPATFLEPGVVAEHSSPTPGILDVGRWPAGVDGCSDRLAAAFRLAGFSAESVPDISRWKHAKLVMNLTNVVDALCRPDEAADALHAAVRAEGERCLAAAGIACASLEEQIVRLGTLLTLEDAAGQARGGSSTWQSLARGTGTVETDYLNGEIVRLGARHGVATPVNARLLTLATEHARLRRPPASLAASEILAGLSV